MIQPVSLVCGTPRQEHAPREVMLLQPTAALADLVHFAEEDAPATDPGVPRLLKEAEVLRPGTYVDMSGKRVTFTEADLQAYAASFDAGDPPPIQLDHSKSARDTQGYVRRLAVVDGRLMALAEFLGSYAVDNVRAGLWKKLSGGLYLEPRRMKELTVTPFPAVGTARLLAEHQDTDPAAPGDGGNDMDPNQKAAEETTEAKADGAQLADGEKCPKCGAMMPAGAKFCPECGVKAKADMSAPAPDLAKLAESNPEAAAILKAHEEKIAQLEASNREQAQLLQLREDTATIEAYLSSGKSVPAMSKLELAFLQTLAADQRTAYTALKQASPAYVQLGRLSKPSTRPEGGSDVEAEVARLREAAQEVRKVAKT